MMIIIPFVIALVVSIVIVLTILIIKNKNNKLNNNIVMPNYNFEGAAYNNIVMYKSREQKALNVILANYEKFTKETLFSNIDDLTNRIVNGQNNGYISQNAFQKTAIDDILQKMRSMKKIDVSIINYENAYMSVAVIFEDVNKDLYQLLMKMNVQNGLLYLDSYNATLWFKKDMS